MNTSPAIKKKNKKKKKKQESSSTLNRSEKQTINNSTKQLPQYEKQIAVTPERKTKEEANQTKLALQTTTTTKKKTTENEIKNGEKTPVK